MRRFLAVSLVISVSASATPLGALGDPGPVPIDTEHPPQRHGDLLDVTLLEDCPTREYHLRTLAMSSDEPRTVAVAVRAEGPPCTPVASRTLTFNLVQDLPAGCNDLLVLVNPGGDPWRFPLDRARCEAPLGPSIASTPSGDPPRWGSPYRLTEGPGLHDGHLFAKARFSGGCGVHTFRLVERPSPRGRVHVWAADLVHDAEKEGCQDLKTQDLALDLRGFLAESCPDLVEIHVPEVLPTGTVFDREILLRTDPATDCAPAQ